jgi:hypothetical protein
VRLVNAVGFDPTRKRSVMSRATCIVVSFTLALAAGCADHKTEAPAETLIATKPASAETTASSGVVSWQVYQGLERLHVVGLDGAEVRRAEVISRGESDEPEVTSEIEVVLPVAGTLRLRGDGTVASSTLDPSAWPLLAAIQRDVGELGGKADGMSCADASIALVQCVSVLPGCTDGPFVVLTCPAALIYCSWLMSQAHDACGWWP